MMAFREQTEHFRVIIHRLPAVLLALTVPILATQQQPDPVSDMQAKVENFIAAQPLHCGRHLLKEPFVGVDEEALRQSVACGVAAAGERKAFWTFKQNQGVDSWVADGLAGTTEGTIYRFSYDSAPCGGPGCASRIRFDRCEKPETATDPYKVSHFRCVK
jgi:hypothetical protein